MTMATTKKQPPSPLAEAHGSACAHRPEPELGYMQWMADAERRRSRGEKQRWCNGCIRYVWDEYWPNASAHLPGPQ